MICDDILTFEAPALHRHTFPVSLLSYSIVYLKKIFFGCAGVAAHRLSLVAPSGDYYSSWCHRL